MSPVPGLRFEPARQSPGRNCCSVSCLARAARVCGDECATPATRIAAPRPASTKAPTTTTAKTGRPRLELLGAASPSEADASASGWLEAIMLYGCHATASSPKPVGGSLVAPGCKLTGAPHTGQERVPSATSRLHS